MTGDYVILFPADDGAKWIMERVPGPKQGGMKIAGSGKAGNHGTVRFTADEHILDEIFRHGETAFTASMDESDGNKAVFLSDFDSPRS